jgi:hypothetical protein
VGKNFYSRIYCKANTVLKSFIENGYKKKVIKLFTLLIEQNGILWILVLANWCANSPIYPTISEDYDIS